MVNKLLKLELLHGFNLKNTSREPTIALTDCLNKNSSSKKYYILSNVHLSTVIIAIIESNFSEDRALSSTYYHSTNNSAKGNIQ